MCPLRFPESARSDRTRSFCAAASVPCLRSSFAVVIHSKDTRTASMGAGAAKQSVYCVSDIHTDHKANWAIISKLAEQKHLLNEVSPNQLSA